MPLVKQTRLTPEKIKANRRNGRKPKRPRREQPVNISSAPAAVPAQPTAGVAERSDLAALRRSPETALDDPVCPESIRAALLGLDEDPDQFTRHHQELIDEWQPSTPTLRQLVRRLAYLMWRQERVERAQDGLMVCRTEKEAGERAQRSTSISHGTCATRSARPRTNTGAPPSGRSSPWDRRSNAG